MSFKISSSRCIEIVKLLDRSERVIKRLQSENKNKLIYIDLLNDLKSVSKLWKEGYDLENFDEWKATTPKEIMDNKISRISPMT